MESPSSLLVAALALLALTAPALLAGVVVSNTANDSTGQMNSSDFAQGYMAQAFDTGTQPAQLTGVTVRLANTGGTIPAKVELWTSALAGTVPVTKVADIGQTDPFANSSDVAYTVTVATSPVLAASSRYWIVVLNPNPGGGSFNWRNSNLATTATSTFGVTLPSVRASSTDFGATWSSCGTGDSQILAITGNFIVTNTNDTGPGSLRQALADAATPGPDTITFAPGLTGHITLNSEITISTAVTLDATSHPSGVTISGNNTTRLFFVTSTGNLTLRSLTLTGGTGANSTYNGSGGCISNSGTLTLTQSTLSGNTADINGGGIYNDAGGTLTLTQSTLSGNTADINGGGIYNLGTLTLTHSTLSGNMADYGGGIINAGTLTLTQSTLSNNTAGSRGGGIYNVVGTLTLTNTIAAGNNAPTDPNIAGFFTPAGANITSGDPRLAPLGNYGGPTQTMPPLPGSPAIDAATASTATSDQRGFPIVGTADIGAYEAGTVSTNYNAYIWETLPTAGNGTINDPLHASTYDFDGDGMTNEAEWLALTNAADGADAFRITQSAFSGAIINVTFPTKLGRTYQLQSSPNLADPWTNIGSATSGTGGTVTLPVNTGSETSYFFRVSVGP